MRTIDADILGILRDKISIIKNRFKKIERVSDKIEDCVDFISIGVYAAEMQKPVFFLVNPNESQGEEEGEGEGEGEKNKEKD